MMQLPNGKNLAPVLAGCLLAVAGICGCQAQRTLSDRQGPPQPAEIAQADYELAWQAVLQVLRDHGFTPDRQDMRAGIITTWPLVSQQFFEFWRADAQGWYQWAESSLHNVRRTVIVRFQRRDDRYVLDLTVNIQRKSMPQRQVTSAGQALQIFGEKLPIYTGERLPADEGVLWVELGEDPQLSQYLLGRIVRILPAAQLSPDSGQG